MIRAPAVLSCLSRDQLLRSPTEGNSFRREAMGAEKRTCLLSENFQAPSCSPPGLPSAPPPPIPPSALQKADRIFGLRYSGAKDSAPPYYPLPPTNSEIHGGLQDSPYDKTPPLAPCPAHTEKKHGLHSHAPLPHLLSPKALRLVGHRPADCAFGPGSAWYVLSLTTAWNQRHFRPLWG